MTAADLTAPAPAPTTGPYTAVMMPTQQPCSSTCWCQRNAWAMNTMRWSGEFPALRFTAAGIEQADFPQLHEPHEVAW